MNWKLLNNYIQGNCTQEELNELGEWLQEDQANEDFFKSFIEQRGEENKDFEPDAQAVWEHFKQNRYPNAKQSFILAEDNSGHRQGRPYWYLSVSAALILLVGFVFLIEQLTVSNKASDENEIAAQEIVTSKGERTNLKLSDGSRVSLNSDSKLKIPVNYNKEARRLYLEGEAFFEVVHDKEHSFEVVTSQGYVKNIGTQFNITAYDSNKIEVALKEGLASMGEVKNGEPENDLAKLTPNKLGILSQQDGLAVSDIENINIFTGWTEGKLVFKEHPFSDVAQQLERWYDIEINIEDQKIAKRTLSATYDNMPLKEVIEVLSASLQVKYERNGKKITFKDKSNANRAKV